MSIAKPIRTIDRPRLRELQQREDQRFVKTHPKCKALAERAAGCLLQGMPMNWMIKWAGAFPIFVQHASGSHFSCIDDNGYVDLCLGDTGAMSGHSPPPR
ncbi:MAG: aspartate aminotransferase family protein, partial [Candidatus Eremiobacteraeota bacterium]|nr:aspartate aminotransferase family protein [Candidatus Eremiobacteraeota bacterium]